MCMKRVGCGGGEMEEAGWGAASVKTSMANEASHPILK